MDLPAAHLTTPEAAATRPRLVVAPTTPTSAPAPRDAAALTLTMLPRSRTVTRVAGVDGAGERDAERLDVDGRDREHLALRVADV
jgi:hypothetical protein